MIQSITRKNEKYFEWWYFHFVAPNLGISLILHKTDIFGLHKQPYMSLSYSRGGKKHIYAKSKLTIEPQEIDGKLFIDSIIAEYDTEIALSVVLDKIKLIGCISKKTSAININEGILYQHDDGRTSHWSVRVPYGEFTGSFIEGQIEHKLQAYVYSDHQYGNIPIQDFLHQWIWGVFSNSNITYGFFRVLTKYNEILDRAFICSVGSCEEFISLNENYLLSISSAKSPDLVVCEPFIEINEKKFNLSISPDFIVRKRLNEVHQHFRFDYIRWFEHNNKSFSGFTEFMKITRC